MLNGATIATLMMFMEAVALMKALVKALYMEVSIVDARSTEVRSSLCCASQSFYLTMGNWVSSSPHKGCSDR